MVRIGKDLLEETKKELSVMKENVKILLFKAGEDPYSKDGEEILKTLSNNIEKISFEIYERDSNEAKKYDLKKFPALVFLDESGKDFGIRFYGIPYGYEYTTLIETIKMLSTKNTQLSDNVLNKVKNIDKDVTIKVFVTPTCPYCPMAAISAYKFAIENDKIKAEVYDASEFPEEASKYNVFAVPKVVINEKISFEGAVPERIFIEKILEAI